MIRVLLADDHTLVREGLRRLLAAEPDIAIAAEAADGDAALAAARARELDVAIVDLSMPGVSGLELVRRLKAAKPALRVLVVSMHGERQYAARALRAGASGYLTKEAAPEQLVRAIRRVATGGVHIPEGAAAALLDQTAASERPHERLSQREFEVFRRLVAGQSPGEVARALHLSVKTVSTHKARILEKMGMRSTAELVRYAVEHRLV